MNDKINNLRYHFEHVLLPQWFYNEEEFRKVLIAEDFTIDQMFFKFCNDNATFDSLIKQFRNSFVRDENSNMIIVNCPPCVDTPQCRIIYMIWNDKKSMYFTLEYDDMLSKMGIAEEPPHYVLCGWDKNQAHLNYGNFDGNDTELYKKIKEIFLNDSEPLSRYNP